jgi:hypothetical protein
LTLDLPLSIASCRLGLLPGALTCLAHLLASALQRLAPLSHFAFVLAFPVGLALASFALAGVDRAVIILPARGTLSTGLRCGRHRALGWRNRLRRWLGFPALGLAALLGGSLKLATTTFGQLLQPLARRLSLFSRLLPRLARFAHPLDDAADHDHHKHQHRHEQLEQVAVEQKEHGSEFFHESILQVADGRTVTGSAAAGSASHCTR